MSVPTFDGPPVDRSDHEVEPVVEWLLSERGEPRDVAAPEAPAPEGDGEDEAARVRAWRVENLTALGLPEADVAAIADRPDYESWHDARALVLQGCPAELVAGFVLEGGDHGDA